MTEEQVREVVDYYAQGVEVGRLQMGRARLEFTRTQELVLRFLGGPPAAVLDVGGAVGAYAAWLTRLGYRLHLIDPVPLHIERAREAASLLDEPFAATLGEARRLPVADDSVDAVLLFGPLYHLPDLRDRLAAWAEARRVLRAGGLVFAIGVSRFAGLLDQLFRPDVSAPGFVRTAYFHAPGELAHEARSIGFAIEGELGVEGPGWLLADFDRRWDDEAGREMIFGAARATEAVASLAGLHSHFLAVARKPAP